MIKAYWTNFKRTTITVNLTTPCSISTKTKAGSSLGDGLLAGSLESVHKSNTITLLVNYYSSGNCNGLYSTTN